MGDNFTLAVCYYNIINVMLALITHSSLCMRGVTRLKIIYIICCATSSLRWGGGGGGMSHAKRTLTNFVARCYLIHVLVPVHCRDILFIETAKPGIAR